MQFKYKAINKEGKTHEGTAEAEDQYKLAHILSAQGETLVRAEEENPHRLYYRATEQLKMFTSRVSTRDKIIFTRNLSVMIDAGLTISRGLEVMERQTHNKQFRKILEHMREMIQEGGALSTALAEYPRVFSSLFVSMVKAGEESGNLKESLEGLGIQMGKAYQLKRRIRGAMMYPSIVVIAMTIVGVLMLIFVVPTLTDTFRELNVELPGSTQFIISVSEFLKNNIIASFGIIVFVLTAFIVGARHQKTKRFFEFALLYIPIVGMLIKETNAARTTRTLSSLLTSGVEIVSALGITKDVLQNTYYKKVLAEAEENIQKGAPIAEAFLKHTELYPVLVGEMMSVGEEAGNLPEMLERIAVFYEDEIDQKTKDMSTIIEPFLMMLIGAVVGFFAVSMISPIYSLSSGI